VAKGCSALHVVRIEWEREFEDDVHLVDLQEALSVVGGDEEHASSERALPETDWTTTHVDNVPLNALQELPRSTDNTPSIYVADWTTATLSSTGWNDWCVDEMAILQERLSLSTDGATEPCEQYWGSTI